MSSVCQTCCFFLVFKGLFNLPQKQRHASLYTCIWALCNTTRPALCGWFVGNFWVSHGACVTWPKCCRHLDWRRRPDRSKPGPSVMHFFATGKRRWWTWYHFMRMFLRDFLSNHSWNFMSTMNAQRTKKHASNHSCFEHLDFPWIFCCPCWPGQPGLETSSACWSYTWETPLALWIVTPPPLWCQGVWATQF